MLNGIIEALSEGKYKNGERNGKLNIIPGFDTHVENIRELKRYMGLMGIDCTVLADNTETFDSPLTGEYEMYKGGTTLADAGDSVNAIGTVSMQSYATTKTLTNLKTKFGQAVEAFNYPVGISAFDEFLVKVSKMTGKPIPEAIRLERGIAVDAATDAHQYFHGKRFAIFGVPDTMIGLVRFLLEMGGEPVHIVSTNGTKKWAKELEAILAASPYGLTAKVYPGKDLWHMRSLLMTEPVDMLIGNSHGKYAARDADIPHVRIGFPIVDRVNLHRYATLGYKGAMNMITWITNAFIEEMDRKSDDAHFELLR
jgi:nitrogenase molybdenum-iron protein beta chain